MVPADSLTSLTVESSLAIRQPVDLVFLLGIVELCAVVTDRVPCLRDIKDADIQLGAMHGGYTFDTSLVCALLICCIPFSPNSLPVWNKLFRQ